MTVKPRTVRALKDARARLRDAAAAAHAVALATCEHEAGEVSRAEDTLDEALDEATDELHAARHVHDLARVGEHTGAHRLAVEDASARHARAVTESEATGAHLRTRARQLRTAEKLVERVDDYYSQRSSREEQRASDDLAARRR